MKKSMILNLIIFVAILIVISLIGIFFFIILKDDAEVDERLYEDLKLVSIHNEYALAVEKELAMTTQYAVFKNTEYSTYRKIFSIPTFSTPEGRLVCWSNDKIYILTPYNGEFTSYNLDDGNISANTNLYGLLRPFTGRFDRILGIDDGYIYIEYSHNANKYHGKIDLDLQEIIEIQEEDIPENLKR